MAYLQIPRPYRQRNLSALGAQFMRPIFPVPPSSRRLPVSPVGPLPVPPARMKLFPETPPAATATPTAPGLCVFQSSPETGGIISVNPCTAGTGGTPIAGTAPAPATPSMVSPVPVTQPTNQPYVDAQGNIWTYSSSGGWQPSGNVSAAMATPGGSPSATVTVPQTSSSGYQSIIDWLNSDSLISGFSNFWIVAGAGAALFLLKNRAAGRR